MCVYSLPSVIKSPVDDELFYSLSLQSPVWRPQKVRFTFYVKYDLSVFITTGGRYFLWKQTGSQPVSLTDTSAFDKVERRPPRGPKSASGLPAELWWPHLESGWAGIRSSAFPVSSQNPYRFCNVQESNSLVGRTGLLPARWRVLHVACTSDVILLYPVWFIPTLKCGFLWEQSLCFSPSIFYNLKLKYLWDDCSHQAERGSITGSHSLASPKQGQ